MAITMMAMIICRTIISQTSNSCNLDSRWAIWRETKKKKNHLNTISTIMGTLVQPQLCTFSYRKALFWPQKQTWHLSNLLLQWDSQNCQCYPRKTRKSRHFGLYIDPSFPSLTSSLLLFMKPRYDHTIRWLQYKSNCKLFSAAGNIVTPKSANPNPEKVE